MFELGFKVLDLGAIVETDDEFKPLELDAVLETAEAIDPVFPNVAELAKWVEFTKFDEFIFIDNDVDVDEPEKLSLDELPWIV